MLAVKAKSNIGRLKYLFMLIPLLIIVMTGCSEGEGSVVAVYDGGEVKEQEFNQYVGAMLFLSQQPHQMKEDDEFRHGILEQYVAIQLIASEADEQLSTLQLKAAQEELNLLKEQYLVGNTTKEWQAMLAEFDTREQAVESFIHLNKVVGQLLDDTIVDTDLATEYERLKDDYVFDIIEISHILVATESADEGEEPLRSSEEALEIVEEIKEKLVQGEDFSELAATYSDDEHTAQDGGTLPAMSGTQLIPLFGQALLELQTGQISEPIEMSYGYHIIKLESRVTEAFDELDDNTMLQLRNVVVNNKFADYIETELPAKNVQLYL